MEEIKSEGEESLQPKKRGKKIAERIFTAVCIVLCVLLIPVFIVNLILTIKGYANPDEVPSVFSIAPMYVITDSMSPTINGGDLIFIQKIAPEEVAVDDIIAFFDPESLDDSTMIVHRVKKIFVDEEGRLGFRTMGDGNNNVYDTFVITGENVVGRYVFHIPAMGRAAMFLRTTAGLIVSISVPLLMLLVYEIVRQIIAIKQEREHENKTI